MAARGVSQVSNSLFQTDVTHGVFASLRFATELAGRKATRRGWDGLAKEMSRAGWFDG